MRLFFAIILAGSLGFSSASHANDKPPAKQPELFNKLTACRTIADPAQRLACFDDATAKMEAAIAARELVVTDKAQMRETRKTLFGFALPRIKLFGGSDEQEEKEEIKLVETTIKSARVGPDGGWRITIADGAVWTQTDGTYIRDPKAGQPIKIRKAALGSYFANVDGQIAIRVKRER